MEEVINGVWRCVGKSNVYLIKARRPWLIAGIETVTNAEEMLKELEGLEGDLSSRVFLFAPAHLDPKLVEGLATLAVLQDGLVVLPKIFFRPEVTGGRVRLPFIKRFKRWWVGMRDYPSKATVGEFIFPVDQGQRLPFAGGWQAYFTAGYGSERVFLHHPDRRILIAGDAIISGEDGAELTLDDNAVEEATSHLVGLKVETILPGRGDVLTGRYVLRDLLVPYSPADF